MTGFRNRFAVALCAVAVMSGANALALPSPALAEDCTGQSSVLGGGSTGDASGGCTGGSGPTGPFDAADHSYDIVDDFGQTRACTDPNGVPSYMAYIARPGETPIYRCVNQNTPGTGGPSKAQARLVVKAPVIRSDFQQKFLVGAPITFDFTEPGTLRKDITGFNAYVEATPTAYQWDFGDGTTSTDPSPTHVFLRKDVNSDHKARVTVSVTYKAVLHSQAADGGPVGEQDLGDIQLTSTPLERPIVEVWSALIPKS